MRLECLVILIIVLVLVIDFLRRHRKVYALCSLPLAILPFFHLLADVTAGRFIPGDTASIRTVLITDLAATLATILFVYLVQDNIKNERRRTTYFVCTSGYTVLLAAILILTYAT